ncbi:MAG TPA: MlaD family protein [Microvirga sp.]|nr:MlaD family protein [Microvirga sp.]
METRANYALIGLFTLLVVASAFGFVYWFSGGDRGQARQAVRIVFSGSVAGLTRGSAVLFNGLRVGEVTELSLFPEDPRRVVSVVEVDRATPVRTDTRARLEYQGLTGVAQIALVGGEPSAPVLTPGPGQPLPTIFADRSDFQDLVETARTIARRADDVLEKLSRVISDNEGSIGRTVQNVERFSQSLGDNAAGIDRFLDQVGQAAERIGPLAEKLEVLATHVDEVVRSVDKQRVARIVENVDSFTQALGDSRQVISDTLKEANSLVRQLNAAAPKLDAALGDVSRVTRAFDPEKVGRTVDNVDRFAQVLGRSGEDVSRIVGNVDAFAKVLGDNRQAIGDAVRDAGSLMRQLNASAPKLETALGDVSRLAQAFDPEKVGRTVDNVDRFAQALGRSGGDVEKAIKDARSLAEKLNRSADRVDGVLKSAEGFFGSASEAGGDGLFEDVREAARSIRVLADNLDKRTAEIASGINRFTGAGLREYEALAAEGRRAVNDISRAVRSLERNPQQVIFGSQPSIPQYNGRR